MQLSDGMVYLRPTKLAHVRKVGPYSTTIGEAWAEMLHWLDKHGLRSQASCGYGLLRDNPTRVDPETCRYDACVPILPHFEGSAARELGLLTLPPGPYARRRFRGNYRDMTANIAGLHDTCEMPQNLRFDDLRPIVTIYLDDPRQLGTVDDLRLDLCVPISTATVPFRIATADAA